MSKNVAVVGAGVMGLATAYHLLKKGEKVTVYEAGPKPGGMAAHFDFGGISIERFYHFICKADEPLFELLEDLGIKHKLRWVETSMGYFIDNELYPWGDPISLLKFPKMSLWQKFRYAMHMFLSTKKKNWSDLDSQKAHEWFKKHSGERTYNLLWKKLFDLKLFEYSDNISAAWIWTRIKRIGTSRKSIFQEELGYIDGGSETLVDCLVEKIEEMGGKVRTRVPISRVEVKDGRVHGVSVDNVFLPHSHVVSTVPTPLISTMVPDLSKTEKEQYDSIHNIGVVCVVVKLRRSISSHFWLNIVDDRFDIPGIIEFSNLRKTGANIVYVPYYLPQSHPYFERSDEFFRAKVTKSLMNLQPLLKEADIEDIVVSRLRYAQPICEPRFLENLPSVQTSINNLQIADTSYYYPEDRGVSESVRFGKILANNITG